MLLVITIDPGVTTGFCVASINDTAPTQLVVGEAEMGCLDLFNWLILRKPDIIICEDFAYRPNMLPGLEMYSRNLIGVIQLFAELPSSQWQWVDWKQPVLVMQQPATKDGYFKTAESLKNVGAYAVGREHGRDATRHFLAWHTFKGGAIHNNRQGYDLEVV